MHSSVQSIMQEVWSCVAEVCRWLVFSAWRESTRGSTGVGRWSRRELGPKTTTMPGMGYMNIGLCLFIVYKSCLLVASCIETGYSGWNNPRMSCKIFVFCCRQSAAVVWSRMSGNGGIFPLGKCLKNNGTNHNWPSLYYVMTQIYCAINLLRLAAWIAV